jgi:hypothetical protein
MSYGGECFEEFCEEGSKDVCGRLGWQGTAHAHYIPPE